MIIDKTTFRIVSEEALVAWTDPAGLNVGTRRIIPGKVHAIGSLAASVSFTSGTGVSVSDAFTGRVGAVSSNWDLIDTVTVQWGDGGSYDDVVAPYASQLEHTYSAAGTYLISVSAFFALSTDPTALYQDPAAFFAVQVNVT